MADFGRANVSFPQVAVGRHQDREEAAYAWGRGLVNRKAHCQEDAIGVCENQARRPLFITIRDTTPRAAGRMRGGIIVLNAIAILRKRTREHYNGRIETSSGNWVFIENIPPSQQNTVRFRRLDGAGKGMALIKERSSWCLNPEKGEGRYPKNTERDQWFVPLSHCRRCEHYRKRGTDRLGYPHCAWQREYLGGDKGAMRHELEIWTGAVEQAREILDAPSE